MQDFYKVKFEGVGDSRIMEYRTTVANQINSSSFNEFEGNDYQQPDVEQQKTLKENLQTRDAKSQIWEQGPEGLAYEALQQAQPATELDVLAAAAPPPDSQPLSAKQVEWLNRAGPAIRDAEKQKKRCTDATEKMHSFINDTTAGEIKNEWNRIVRGGGDRAAMVRAFITRIRSGAYLPLHTEVRNKQMARLSSYLPDADGNVTPSIDTVDKLGAVLTLEQDVTDRIEESADASRQMTDHRGNPLVVAAPRSDAERIAWLEAVMFRNFETTDAITIIKEEARSEVPNYDRLVVDLRKWINENKKSKWINGGRQQE